MVKLGTVMLIPTTMRTTNSLTYVLVQESWRENVTQVMVDDISIAERKSEHAACVGRGSSKPHPISSKRYHSTDVRGHGDLIQEWITDGHIAIIGH